LGEEALPSKGGKERMERMKKLCLSFADLVRRSISFSGIALVILDYNFFR
jgi:hypothetical protein